MSIQVKQTEPDGATVVEDDDGFVAVLRPGQWESLAGLPPSEQRTRVEQYVVANRRDTSRDRSARDEQAMDAARDSSSGESHQEGEK